MDAFDQEENDPAADFFKREQHELGDFKDELDFINHEALGSYDANQVDGDLGDASFVRPDISLEQAIQQLPQDPFSAVREQDVQQTEPEKIRLWRQHFRERIEKKDSEEITKKKEQESLAKNEIKDWYNLYYEQLEKTKASNRQAERTFIKERDDTIPGGEWERVCRLCDFNPKASKNTKDVSRMRGILLQLKQQPIPTK